MKKLIYILAVSTLPLMSLGQGDQVAEIEYSGTATLDISQIILKLDSILLEVDKMQKKIDELTLKIDNFQSPLLRDTLSFEIDGAIIIEETGIKFE